MINSIVKAFKWRYSVKSFNTSASISSELIDVLEKTVEMSATSYGLQLYKVFFVQNTELKKQLTPLCYGQKQVEEAPLTMVLCRKSEFNAQDVNDYINLTSETRGQKPEELSGFKKMLDQTQKQLKPEELKNWLDKQVYIILGKLLTVCALVELDSSPMEGFNPVGVDELLDLKEKGYSSVLILPVGYRNPDDSNSSRKKVRKPLQEVVGHI
jgi:nitroreductase / dihydropteridine reductase